MAEPRVGCATDPPPLPVLRGLGWVLASSSVGNTGALARGCFEVAGGALGAAVDAPVGVVVAGVNGAPWWDVLATSPAPRLARGDEGLECGPDGAVFGAVVLRSSSGVGGRELLAMPSRAAHFSGMLRSGRIFAAQASCRWALLMHPQSGQPLHLSWKLCSHAGHTARLHEGSRVVGPGWPCDRNGSH